jgi:hypothetical protein
MPFPFLVPLLHAVLADVEGTGGAVPNSLVVDDVGAFANVTVKVSVVVSGPYVTQKHHFFQKMVFGAEATGLAELEGAPGTPEMLGSDGSDFSATASAAGRGYLGIDGGTLEYRVVRAFKTPHFPSLC